MKFHFIEFNEKELPKSVRCTQEQKLVRRICTVAVAVLTIPVALAWNESSPAQRRLTDSDFTTQTAKTDSVERAIAGVCQARRSDYRGTAAIDEMSRTRPLPPTDPRVIAGKSRAQALLPAAKRLVPFALRRVAINNGVEPLHLKWIITRVQAVKNITADAEQADNSAWRPSEPDTIRFGTLFLVGLRSDEAMIAVLAHELTHAINGSDEGLQPLFTRVKAKATVSGIPVGFGATVELTCDLVALEVARDYISQTKGQGTRSPQRLARALQKDCVSTDLGDENHLSPRATMRTLLTLQPSLIRALPTDASGQVTKKRNSKASKQRGRRKRQ